MPKPLRILMIGPGLQVRGGVSAVERLILDNLPPDVAARHLATMVDGSSATKALVFLAAIPRAFWELLRGVDVVHIHFSVKASTVRKTVMARIAMLFGRKVIMHAHGADWHEYIETVSPRFRRFVLTTLRRCDCLIALSEGWRRYYSDVCGVDATRVVAMPNPVAVPSEVPDRSGRPLTTFAFLGIMDDRKGAPTIVEAFALLPDETKKRARVTMAGDGEVERIRRLVNELELGEFFSVRDWLEPEERDRVLAESDVLLLPSHHEGMPMSVLEAMAWGLPPITTPVGGIPEIVRNRESGILISPGNPEELARAMEELVNDSDLRKELSGNARRSIQSLEISQYIARLVALYRHLVAREPAVSK